MQQQITPGQAPQAAAPNACLPASTQQGRGRSSMQICMYARVNEEGASGGVCHNLPRTTRSRPRRSQSSPDTTDGATKEQEVSCKPVRPCMQLWPSCARYEYEGSCLGASGNAHTPNGVGQGVQQCERKG